jgi:hypothetical protein
MENMTSGALSVSDRPFHCVNPNTARVPTSEGMLRKNRCSICGDDAGNCFGDGRSVSREIIGGAPGIQTIAEIFVVLGKQWMDHRKAHAVD